jgi:hypothetical protein
MMKGVLAMRADTSFCMVRVRNNKIIDCSSGGEGGVLPLLPLMGDYEKFGEKSENKRHFSILKIPKSERLAKMATKTNGEFFANFVTFAIYNYWITIPSCWSNSK